MSWRGYWASTTDYPTPTGSSFNRSLGLKSQAHIHTQVGHNTFVWSVVPGAYRSPPGCSDSNFFGEKQKENCDFPFWFLLPLDARAHGALVSTQTILFSLCLCLITDCSFHYLHGWLFCSCHVVHSNEAFSECNVFHWAIVIKFPFSASRGCYAKNRLDFAVFSSIKI